MARGVLKGKARATRPPEVFPMSSVVVSPSLHSSPIQIAVASYATCSDVDLVKGLVANEPAAWQALVVRYGRLIQSCIHRVTARFPSVVRAEDGAEIMSML